MKKFIILFAMVMISVIAFGQTPVWDGRIADTTTVFTVNISVGFKVYSIAENAVWVCKHATAAGTKISSMAGQTSQFYNFTQLATGAAHAAVTVPSLTAHGLKIISGQALGMDTAYAGHTGTLSGTDWTTFNGKLGSEVDGSITNEGALTVVDGSGTADIHSNTSTSTNVTFAVSGALTVDGAGSTITIANTSKTYIAEPFEIAGDSTGHCILTLAHTPVTGTIIVQMNGYPLAPTTQFTVVETLKIRMPFTCDKYSKFNISYSY